MLLLKLFCLLYLVSIFEASSTEDVREPSENEDNVRKHIIDAFSDQLGDFEKLSDVLSQNYERGNSEEPSFSSRPRFVVEDRDSDGLSQLKSMTRILDTTSQLLGKVMGVQMAPTMRIRVASNGDRPGSSMEEATSLIDKITSIPTRIVGNLFGPHICVHELNDDKDLPSTGGMVVEHNCFRLKNARVCRSSRTSNKKLRTTTRIEACCDGYDTRDIVDDGCDIELKDTLAEELQSRNLTSSREANATVLFFPNSSKTYSLSGKSNPYDWVDGVILKDDVDDASFKVRVRPGAGNNGITKVTFNCASMKNEWKTVDGNLIEFDSQLRPLAENLLQVLQQPRYSTFYKLMSKNLRDRLNSTTSATVFAFTDDVFALLPKDVQNQIHDASDCIEEFLEQHVVDGTLCSSDLPEEMTTVHGNVLTFATTEDEKRKVGGAELIETDVFTSNGVVHVIGDVLLHENVLPWREVLRKYNTELADNLTDFDVKTPLTVFVPSEEIGEPVSNLVVSNEMISNFDRRNFTTDANSTIFTGWSRTSALAEVAVKSSLSISLAIATGKQGDKFPRKPRGRVACSRFVAPAVHACRAVFYFIDKPLPVATQSVEEFLSSDVALSNFYRLWQKSNVSSAVNNSPITVFAPSNDAYSKNFFKKLVNGAAEKIDEFVKRHVFRDVLCKSDLRKTRVEVRRAPFSSLNGLLLTPTTHDSEILVNDVNIMMLEKICTDGVVHVIDAPLEKRRTRGETEFVRTPFDVLSHVFG